MAENILGDYYAALERLKRKKVKINNDTVAVEAGRKKGTIKKSRAIYTDLIRDIDLAAAEQKFTKNPNKTKMENYRHTAMELRRLLDAAYAREISLLAELFEAKRTIHSLSGTSVFPLRGTLKNSNDQ